MTQSDGKSLSRPGASKSSKYGEGRGSLSVGRGRWEGLTARLGSLGHPLEEKTTEGF